MGAIAATDRSYLEISSRLGPLVVHLTTLPWVYQSPNTIRFAFLPSTSTT